MLSVVIPVYNVEKYLKQCLESIINQSYKDIEIILVDDGSIDNSGKICDEYKRTYQNVNVLHQENKGLYGARLAGVKFCQTKYVTFVDADDFIEKDAYVRAIKAMENDIDIILFDIYNYSDELNVKKKKRTFFQYGVYDRSRIEKIVYPKLMWNGSVGNAVHPHLVTKIFKCDLLREAFRLYERHSQYYGEDNIITYTSIKLANKIEFIDHAYYNYRARDIGEVPSYIVSANFFDEVYSLYKFLKELFAGETDILRQLDMLYIEAVNCKRKAYGLSISSSIRYMFPFDKVEKNRNVVLYGAGEVGRAYREQLNSINFCKDILWVDKNYNKYNRVDILPVDSIVNYSYDYIVIAVANKDIAMTIMESLSAQGVTKEKIVYSDSFLKE